MRIPIFEPLFFDVEFRCLIYLLLAAPPSRSSPHNLARRSRDAVCVGCCCASVYVGWPDKQERRLMLACSAGELL